jgi:hypothetical protein
MNTTISVLIVIFVPRWIFRFVEYLLALILLSRVPYQQ